MPLGQKLLGNKSLLFKERLTEIYGTSSGTNIIQRAARVAYLIHFCTCKFNHKLFWFCFQLLHFDSVNSYLPCLHNSGENNFKFIPNSWTTGLLASPPAYQSFKCWVGYRIWGWKQRSWKSKQNPSLEWIPEFQNRRGGKIGKFILRWRLVLEPLKIAPSSSPPSVKSIEVDAQVGERKAQQKSL